MGMAGRVGGNNGSGNITEFQYGGTQGRPPSWMDVGYGGTPKQTAQQYDGAGGTWRNYGNGWQSGTGQRVNDLQGYLGMRENLVAGSNFRPYQQGMDTAIGGMNSANKAYQALLTDPRKVNQTAGYKFAVDQGNQAINRSAAAKGALNSGGVLAELAKYGQGMASGLYQEQLGNYAQNVQNQGNRVNSLANIMQNAQQFGINSGYYNQPSQTGVNNPNRPSMW